MTRPVLWLDLETTGTNEIADEIIEVGMAVMTPDLAPWVLDRPYVYQEVYKTSIPLSSLSPEVLDMHYKNGLWDETIRAKRYASSKEAESSILSWLGKLGALKGGDASLILAGSGVSHFDRRFIRANWPNLDRRLTFWHLDVGVVRRFVRQWLGEVGIQAIFPYEPEQATHRAMDDVYSAIKEARAYRDWGETKGESA